MNQTFSLKRFSMLFKKHTVENIRSYAMSLFVFFAILTVFTLISNYHSEEPHQVVPFIIFYLAAGTIFTSNIFINLGDKRKRIATLTLPASQLEKFLVGWVYSWLIFQVLFIAIYYAILWAVIKFGDWPKTVEIMDIFSDKQKVYLVIVAFQIMHALMLFGAIAFKKMHFIKTVFVVFIVAAVIWLINDQILQAMIHHKISANPPFGGLSFSESPNNHYNVDLDESAAKWIISLFLVLPVVVWFAAYFKLKEKQV